MTELNRTTLRIPCRRYSPHQERTDIHSPVRRDPNHLPRPGAALLRAERPLQSRAAVDLRLQRGFRAVPMDHTAQRRPRACHRHGSGICLVPGRHHLATTSTTRGQHHERQQQHDKQHYAIIDHGLDEPSYRHQERLSRHRPDQRGCRRE